MQIADFGLRIDRPRKSIAAVSMILLVAATANVSAAQRTWTRSEILATADKEAQRFGYDVEHMSVSFDVYNSQWRDYLKSRADDGGTPNVEAKLNGREYWAVYYGPMKAQPGGDPWVFLDRDTGSLIETLQGE